MVLAYPSCATTELLAVLVCGRFLALFALGNMVLFAEHWILREMILFMGAMLG